MKKIAFGLLSIWIVFHGLALILMPSPQSILVDLYGRLFGPYLSQLGMNTTWNLFSPDPAQALYGQVQLIHPKYETGEKVILFPKSAHGKMLNPLDQRGLYFFRYMMLDPKRMEEFLVPWFCKSDEKPREVWIQVHRLWVPPLKDLVLQEEPFEAVSNMTFEKQFYCDSQEELME